MRVFTPDRIRIGTKELRAERTEQGAVTEYRFCDEGLSVLIRERIEGSVTGFEVEAECARGFGEEAFTLPLHIGGFDDVLTSWHDKRWWMIGGFPKADDDLEEQIQFMLLRRGETHYSCLMLCGDEFRAEADREGLHLRTGVDGLKRLSGMFLSVCEGTEPIGTVRKNYASARERNGIRVPLVSERSCPSLFDGFGWCSWNAFYQNVTAEGIYRKLDEFREKKIPVRWIIIDDGWSLVRDNMLWGFEADPVKFPEGLEGCIRRIREEYGIPDVGVWHSFNGYWKGIHPESPLAREWESCLMKTVSGQIVPSDDPDRAFLFWDAWHARLARSGVTFLKVDNQSSSQEWLKGTVSTTSGARRAHEALERSVQRHFGGHIIDCMGMDMENYLQRPYSAVSRNSDDFFPDVENGFAKHITQNVYSALWHSNVYTCDYDMWWSGKSSPVQSGVLRAISGGPVYISDAVGESDPKNILPVCGTDGDLFRLERAAIPTTDRIYTDCLREKRILTVFNVYGDAFALAAFNITGEPLSDTADLSATPGLNGTYLAYEYFSHSESLVNAGTRIPVSLEAGGAAVWSLYPVRSDENGRYAMVGDRSRYVGIACPGKERVDLPG